MEHHGTGAGVGILVVANVVTVGYVWDAVGAWLLPWMMVFWLGPTVGLVLWVLQR